jgi:hypothetical protein
LCSSRRRHSDARRLDPIAAQMSPLTGKPPKGIKS